MGAATFVCSLVVLAGCASGGGSPSTSTASGARTPCTAVTGAKVTVVTRNFDYSPNCLTLVGDQLTVVYDNAEKGVEHNFHLVGATTADGETATNLKSGPHTESITYVKLKPGRYTWICDLHPAMRGTLTVTAP